MSRDRHFPKTQNSSRKNPGGIDGQALPQSRPMSSSLTKGLVAARSTGNSFNPVNQPDATGKDSLSSLHNVPLNEGQTGLISVQGSQMMVANSNVPEGVANKLQAT